MCSCESELRVTKYVHSVLSRRLGPSHARHQNAHPQIYSTCFAGVFSRQNTLVGYNQCATSAVPISNETRFAATHIFPYLSRICLSSSRNRCKEVAVTCNHRPPTCVVRAAARLSRNLSLLRF